MPAPARRAGGTGLGAAQRRSFLEVGPLGWRSAAQRRPRKQVPQYNSRRFQCHPPHYPGCHYKTGAPDPCQAHPPCADRGAGSAGGTVKWHDHFLQPPRPSYLHHIGAFTDPLQITLLARERCCCFSRKKKCFVQICFSSCCFRLLYLSQATHYTSFAFGSLISAVDPVATIAIFNALHVDPVLNMLVFGESILNDAVSIVLTNTAEGLTRKNMSDVSGWQTFLQALGYFLKMFFGSAALGTLTGLISALVLKHIDLRKTPSLEFGMMIIFAYLPYGLAEGISLSGIMAILFSGIVMSHYTHHNLSPVTQILMQQTLRTVAFLCETCVFAFLGLSIFSFPHKFEISFVIWCIVLVLFGRAVNIFPLSYLLNFFRDHKITPKMMFIMWFSGLRGAIPYALSLHLDLEPMEKRQLIGTTTIIIVLFTILLLGGSTMPLIRLMDIEDAKARRRNKKDVNLSKTEKMGNTVESEHLSELTEEEYEAHYIRRQDLKGFLWLDAKYLNPFFTRRLTQEDLHHGRIQMKTLTNKWYEEVRQGPSGSEDDEQELL
ncbi:PREDICTED: sodium/hydrogen exchanger 8 isoform X1 [Hipposideros armiger]|uniref:Sodium/hydrogen exchanger n=1 Tax=Hipposideros armiger TaxID=186990 RepID=A0A8B7R728_HIPAR|nr:PREDICTED: sodium/hydrogen exchanger 8 isoform X1 [Hipposideros armiger]